MIIVALLVGATARAPGASAVGTVFQAVPVSDWNQPAGPPLDGLGQFVLVGDTPPGAGQVTSNGYLYAQHLNFSSGPVYGTMGLSSDARGHIAGMKIGSSILEIPYPWTSGRIYFLIVYHLGGDAWGGWVYDYAARAWTVIGQLQAPHGSGLLGAMSGTAVDNATGLRGPGDPFEVESQAAVDSCAAFPRVDAWFFPPIGYRGLVPTVASPGAGHTTIGTCVAPSTVEGGWAHYRLGATPVAPLPRA